MQSIAAGLSILVISGIDTLRDSIMKTPIGWETATYGPTSSTTWYMRPENINTPSNKKSLFMFDPQVTPYGPALVEYIALITPHIRSMTSHPMSAGIGTHYYDAEPTNVGFLDAHNDVNMFSVINSDGPTSVWCGERWLKCSKNVNDSPDILIPADGLLVMTGWTQCLLSGLVDKPIYHKVDPVSRPKLTLGIFYEIADKAHSLILPSGKTLSASDLYASYFEAIPMTDEIRHMKEYSWDRSIY